MKLIVISNPLYLDGEARLINQLFDAGLEILHLRKEAGDRRAYRKLIGAIDPAYRDRLVLNGFHELAEEFGIRRLHYSEQWRRAAGAIRKGEPVFGNGNKDRVISTSIHDLKDINEAEEFDYAFYGPVFDSLSKPGYRGVEERGFKLKRNAGKMGTEIIALGGIDVSRIDQVQAMNFGGLAVLGAVWNAPADAVINFKRIQKKCREI